MVYIHASLNFGGGVGAVVKQLTQQQIKHGDKVYILAREFDSAVKAYDDEIKIIHLKDKKCWIPKIVKGYNLKRAYKKIKKQNANEEAVLICHCIGVAGLLGSIPKQSIIVLHGHINTSGITSELFYKLLYKRYKKSNFVACSNECAEYYRNQFNIRCKVILNGTICSGAKEKHYQDKKDFIVGMISNLDEHKGFKYFLEAAVILCKKYNHVKFYIAGTNSENFNFDDFIQNNKLSSSIKYFGEVENAANTLLPKIDLLVLPSVMEGLPMSLIEAQCYGIPILATKVGGIPELLVNGYNGYFIKRDIADIVSKVELCLDENRYKTLMKHSVEVYDAKFSAVRMYEEYKKETEKIIGLKNV